VSEMPRVYLCPVCNGAGDVHCYCDGRTGLIDEARALDFARETGDPTPTPLPEPPTEMPHPCHDCAFRRDSQEHEDPYGALTTLAEHVGNGETFHCHQGMHSNARGSYVPIYGLDANRKPIGYPVCAGWRAMRDAFERGDSVGEIARRMAK